MLSKLKSKSLVLISTTVVTIAIIRSAYLFLNRKKKDIEKLENDDEEEVQSARKDLLLELSTRDSLPQHIEREIKKEQRRKNKMKDLAMKSPMYDNVRLMVSDLCMIGILTK